DSLKSWFTYHLAHEFNPDSLNILLDEMAAEIRPYIEEYKHRAPYIGTMYNGWQNAIDEIKDFNIARPDFMRSHLLGLTDVDENESIVESFYLSQNYPNPFNPSTTIKYSIPSLETPLSRGVGSVLVTLKIYDLLGKKITTLVNEEKPSGNYSVQWDATKHSGGLYFYTINVGGFRETKKMILLK
ncbi:MAG: T9SS type A sorting domain-containing protein, partial [Melioribacteraceae bacterium]